MEPLRNSIIGHLNHHVDNEEKFHQELQRMVKKEGDEIYSLLLNILTNESFSSSEARKTWQNIRSHQKSMSDALGRPVSLMTATCDYFSTIRKIMKIPKLIELKAFEETTRSSYSDGLTGLFNRRYFDSALTSEIKRAQRYKSEVSLLFMDLDHFKNLNDTYGHQGGDHALKSVGAIIQDQKRTEDIGCRYGGEELILILPQTTKVKSLILAERVRKAVEKMSFNFNGQSFKVTLSGGIANYPVDAQEKEDLLKCADLAVYEAKRKGRNKIFPYAARTEQN
ncbi:MAG: hypothetical protein COV67_05700 [Nitrospinae bacterium CG11_big_fil_rev_8_21_14_0_20_56_8]|nr:MAG: hypothetical protein COV67_05700 [Nitrospinae bacterium CG11_big_fil_rev_8_21_14_0_20_56_8]